MHLGVLVMHRMEYFLVVRAALAVKALCILTCCHAPVRHVIPKLYTKLKS